METFAVLSVEPGFSEIAQRVQEGRQIAKYTNKFFKEYALIEKQHCDKLRGLCASSLANFETDIVQKTWSWVTNDGKAPQGKLRETQ